MDTDRLADTFVELADTLVAGFDVLEFLQVLTERCTELTGVDAAGLLLADARGSLQLVAASDVQVRAVESVQLRTAAGPGVDAFATGRAIGAADLTDTGGAGWPLFTASATAAGFRAVDAVPMRLRTEVIGALTLFRSAPGAAAPGVLRTATALVEVATIGLLQQRSIHHHQALAGQLQSALTSRVTIEQAKGIIAARLRIDMDGAFAALRGFARGGNLRLADVAQAVIAGRIGTDELLAPMTKRKPQP